MYYNQELGLCIEFGPVRVDSVRRRGGPPPPWIKSPLRRFTPSWTSTRVTCDCLPPFVHPLLSQVGWRPLLLETKKTRKDRSIIVCLAFPALRKLPDQERRERQAEKEQRGTDFLTLYMSVDSNRCFKYSKNKTTKDIKKKIKV